MPPNNRYSIAVYSLEHGQVQLHGADTVDVSKTDDLDQRDVHPFNLSSAIIVIDFVSDKSQTLTTPRMSSYYTTINVMEGQAWQNMSHDMRALAYNDTVPPNMETAIRSKNEITIHDLREAWAWTQQESKTNASIKPVLQASSYYHERPAQLGYYCLFYNRPGQHLTADCPNVSQILTEHAHMLYSSGIDFIALDDTNLDGAPEDAYSDILQLRPAEIIFSEWHALRNASGTRTPDVVTCNKANAIEWKSYLALYDEYSDMVLTVPDASDGNKLKKVFFVPQNSGLNQSVVDLIADDFGKKDVLVQGMWGGGGMSEQLILNGTWTFFYPCRHKRADGTFSQSVSMESAAECNFVMTQKSALGTQISASMSWQNNYGSLPFSAPSKLNGRTFLLIIQDVLSMQPDNVLFPSFNEHTASGFDGTSNAAFGGNNTWGVGLFGDAQRTTHGFFVDTFGSERSRSIEPTDESGDYYYRLMQSCIRVVRLAYVYDIASKVRDTGRVCNVHNEICCAALQSYVDVWSLFKAQSGDHIVSNSMEEVDQIVDKDGYQEICTPSVYADTTVFCTSNADLDTFDAHRGPFIVYGEEHPPSDGSRADVEIERVVLYRCIASDGYHFIAASSECDGIGGAKMEYVLGYAAVSPSTAMPRRLVRCQVAGQSQYYHVVDDECQAGDQSSAVLGYVFG